MRLLNKEGQINVTMVAIVSSITLVSIFLLIFIFLIYFAPRQDSDYSNTTDAPESREQETQEIPDDIEIFVASQIIVKDYLKAPATADFPHYSEANITELDEKRWQVTSYVDAENSFGAKIRNNYSVIVNYINDEWEFEDAEIGTESADYYETLLRKRAELLEQAELIDDENQRTQIKETIKNSTLIELSILEEARDKAIRESGLSPETVLSPEIIKSIKRNK